MILCVNPNAAIDKTVIVNRFRLGEIHRPEAVIAQPGGKGANAARALRRLGETPVVTGWVGGFAGRFIEAQLRREGIESDFVITDFESRTCLSILDGENGTLTEIYEKGDPVPAEQVEAMITRFGEMIGRFAAVTLSGSLPPGVPNDFYARLIALARQAGVPAFLDSSGEGLRQGAAARPFLIKPNESEVAVLVGRPLKTTADFAAAAAEISARGKTIVVLSLGQEGAIAARGDEVIHARNPRVAARSAVGSGDSMLAGLAFGFSRGYDLAEAVRCGVAAGTANTLVIGAGQFTMADFERVHAATRIERLQLPPVA